MWGERVYGKSMFCSDPKTALKYSLVKKQKKIKQNLERNKF